jgi:streptomycin 6-kinase
MLVVPEQLGWWRETQAGAAWLDRLPAVAAELADRWALVLGGPFEGSHVSLAIPAERADGSRAVLKLNFPDSETEHEPDALAFWDGVGAARLLERADDLAALLVERLDPGAQLWAVGDEDEANTIAAQVLGSLQRDPGEGAPFRALAGEAERWSAEIPERWQHAGRPFERSLVEELVRACDELAAGGARRVLLHQDFHGGNVLKSGDGWRAIDPKPLVGDPAFDTASLLRDRRGLLADGRFAARMRRRLDLLSEALELDRERMRLWGVVHALAWGVDVGGHDPQLVECARLLSRVR